MLCLLIWSMRRKQQHARLDLYLHMGILLTLFQRNLLVFLETAIISKELQDVKLCCMGPSPLWLRYLSLHIQPLFEARLINWPTFLSVDDKEFISPPPQCPFFGSWPCGNRSTTIWSLRGSSECSDWPTNLVRPPKPTNQPWHGNLLERERHLQRSAEKEKTPKNEKTGEDMMK